MCSGLYNLYVFWPVCVLAWSQSAEESVLSEHGPMAFALATLTKPAFQAKAGEMLLLPDHEVCVCVRGVGG